jgi:hypothetical protein
MNPRVELQMSAGGSSGLLPETELEQQEISSTANTLDSNNTRTFITPANTDFNSNQMFWLCIFLHNWKKSGGSGRRYPL